MAATAEAPVAAPRKPVKQKLTPEMFRDIKERMKDLRYTHGEDIDRGHNMRLPGIVLKEYELMVEKIDELQGTGRPDSTKLDG